MESPACYRHGEGGRSLRPAAAGTQLRVATRGKEFNLTCSSLGSSAAPATHLPALYTAATSRDTLTSAMLSLVPRLGEA